MEASRRGFVAHANGRSAIPQAVFLHSGWRSSGTWIWSEFRAHPRVMSFYEPLNEHLAGMTSERLVGSTHKSWESRHPQIRPYFEEYAPFVSADREGVRGYDRSFAFERFFASSGEPFPRIYEYLSSLLRYAHDAGKVPVLKFCRSLGRVGWMREQFPEVLHIAVVRDPWAQWLSAQRLASAGNRYFLVAPLFLLARNARNPAVRPVLDALHIDAWRLRRFTREKTFRACDAFVESASEAACYRSFLAFWIATARTSLPHVDLTLDSDVLASSRAYRKEVHEQIVQLTGIEIDLHSARRALVPSFAAQISAAQVEECHLDALQACLQLEQSAATASALAALDIVRRKLTDARAAALQAS
jgi:hypothetical protein